MTSSIYREHGLILGVPKIIMKMGTGVPIFMGSPKCYDTGNRISQHGRMLRFKDGYMVLEGFSFLPLGLEVRAHA